MLKYIELKDFTVFGDPTLMFGENINVFVGANGMGKTHALKLAYCITGILSRAIRDSSPTKAYLQPEIARKLNAVFKPDHLGRLARRKRPGRQRSEVGCHFFEPNNDTGFSFNTSSKSEVSVDQVPKSWVDKVPVYLPTRELLSIYPGFVSLYDNTYLEFEETWRDTCSLLGAPLARGPREGEIRKLLVPLEEAMNGTVVLDNGRFYLNVKGVPTEMHLVAEGLRKLAMIARLIATGSLVGRGYLFWDEPEANLNPKITKLIARTILHLSRSGIQIFIATHSLFLLREIDILLQSHEFKTLRSRFFGLHPHDDGVTVTQGDTIDDIGEIDALQEELTQSERYLAEEPVR